MRGLARHERDASLLRLAGAGALQVPRGDELRALLQSALGAETEMRGAQWNYARWKPERSLCLGWQVELGDGQRAWVVWKRFLEGTVWLSAFPEDRVLPGLARAFDLQRRARDLQPLHADQPLRWRHASAHLLRYKPERRAVLRLDWNALRPPPAHALRVLTLRAAARCLAARSVFDFAESPRLLASRPEHGLVYEEWLELEPDALAPDSASALLARLHAHELPGGVPACPRLPAHEELDPLFALDAHLLRRARALPIHDPEGADVWSHGDFHPGQLALAAGKPALLDLDSLGRAAPARDLASWIAQALRVPGQASIDAAFDAALQPYALAGGKPPPARELRQAVRAELVRLAAAGLRRLELGALEHAQQLLDVAEACVAPATSTPPALARALAALESRCGPAVQDSIRRCDLDEHGSATWMLGEPASPRWFRAREGELQELELGKDARLPGSAQAQQLIESGAAQLLSWRPGRRFVIGLAERVRKGVRAGRAAALAERQEQIERAARGTSVRVARVLGQDARQATVDLERLPGRALDFAADRGEVQALARLLQDWQALALGGLAPHSRSDELQLLDRLADRHARASGSLPSGFEQELEALELQTEGGARNVTAHRDLFEAQILVAGEGLGLLDFDLACTAEPELDPANLLAHLDLARARGRIEPRAAAAFESDFLAACAERQLVRPEPLRFYRRTSLLRLALVWRLRAGGPGIARTLLARAQVLADA